MVKNYGEKHALKPTRMLGRLLKILKEFFFSFHSFCTEYLVYGEGSTCIFQMEMVSMKCALGLGSAGFLHRTL